MGVPSSGEYMPGSGIKIPATAFVKSIKVFFPLMIPFAFLGIVDGRAFPVWLSVAHTASMHVD